MTIMQTLYPPDYIVHPHQIFSKETVGENKIFFFFF